MQEFCSKVPSNAKVLDVGCGTGIPIARYLIQNGFEVVGIDLSKEMVTVARQNLPGTSIIQINMTKINFPLESFDGVISCYAVFHVPRGRHAGIFQSFNTVLKTQGIMLVSVGNCEGEEVDNYFGVNMFWSHYDPSTTEALITDAGFDIKFGRNVECDGETHYWVLARKAESNQLFPRFR